MSDTINLSPLLPTDPAKIGDYWLTARLLETAAGITYIGKTDSNEQVMLLQLVPGAGSDPVIQSRFLGLIEQRHIDTIRAIGGSGMNTGRYQAKFQQLHNAPNVKAPFQPPWAALAYDGTPAAEREARRILTEIDISNLSQQGRIAGPNYHHHWAKSSRIGATRLWPLPWPGRYDRAGWVSILVSWLLMLLIMFMAIIMLITVFLNAKPTTAPAPVPTASSGSPSSSASPSPSPSKSNSESGGGAPRL